jgi:hypothetical protein
MTMYKLDDPSIELIESKQEENKTHLSLIKEYLMTKYKLDDLSI